jgi:exonuclease III
MLIASLNANKGLGTPGRASLRQAWLDHWRPDLLFVQEPCTARSDPAVEVAGYEHLGGNTNVGVWRRARSSVAKGWSVAVQGERWLSLTSGRLAIHDVYFPSGAARERAELLDRLTAQFSQQRDHVHW